MDHHFRRQQVKSAKPSRLTILIALLIAISLPYFLVKTFAHHKMRYTSKRLTLPKIESPVTATANESPVDNEWRVVKTHEGDTLGKIFARIGLSAQVLQQVLQDNPHAKMLTTIKPNQQIQFMIKDKQLKKLIMPFTTTQFIVVYQEGSVYKTKINSRKMNSHNHYLTATVRGSLFGTAKRMNIPYKLVNQMTEIFNWNIDFSRDVRDGDQFTIIYKAYYIEDKLVGTGDILAVTYTNRNRVFEAVRHTNSMGSSDFYTPEGTSLKKAFSRYPIQFSHISSTFSTARFHPILRYKRAHKGIDLAARMGTPIHSTGDGVIASIGRDYGYGNVIKINHQQNFTTVYGHMLRFAKGLSRGSRVKRGQIIGYVGQTGLATGPHCHYEFHINHVPRNPATVDLPRSAPIPARELASFRANAHSLLAHLKLFEEASLASLKTRSADVG